jgi:hypothetical protein
VGLHKTMAVLCPAIHSTLLLPVAVLLTADARAKVGDVGLARFMAADYMSAQAALGTFSWTVRMQGCCLARRPLAVRGGSYKEPHSSWAS